MATEDSRTAAGDATATDRTLLILTALGALSTAWAAFLWRELLRSRSGLDPFCGFGGGGCSELWDGAFASTVHALTGVPVAGWGVMWGLVATVLPLLAWMTKPGPRHQSLRSATRITALAGMAAVTVFVLVSALEGAFCQSCLLSYVLTAAYVVVAILRLGTLPSARGAMIAAGTTVAAYFLLLYPGLRTPSHTSEQERFAAAVEAATGGEDSQAATTPGGAVGGETLESFLTNLPPDLQQGVSDSLFIHLNTNVETSETPRAVALGNPDAPVRITDFSDTLCSHCADLHETLGYLAQNLPPSSFAVDLRQFPLDGTCNPNLLPPQGLPPGTESVRCLAARVLVCAENSPSSFELGSRLFERQEELTVEMVYELAAPVMPRAELEACVASPETEAKLQQDIAYAWQYRPRGTPLVLVNGRQGTPFGPFLYAMVLAGGNSDHPAFALLPEPSIGG